MAEGWIQKNRVIVLLFIIISIYFMVFRKYGINRWDEGVPLNGALRVISGEHPGRDFSAYAPGRYLIFAASLVWSDGSIDGPRAAMSLFGASIACLLFSLCRRFVSSSLASLLILVFLAAPFYYFYRFLTFSLLLAMIGVIDFRKMRTWAETFWVGLIFGVLPWLREDLGIFFLLIMLAVCLLSRVDPSIRYRRMAACLISFSMFAGEIAYWGGIPGFADYLERVYRSSAGHIRKMSIGLPAVWQPEYWSESSPGLLWEDLLIWSVLFLILMNFAVLGFRAWKRLEIAVIHFFVLISLVFFLIRPGFGNLLRILPVIVVQVAAVLGEGCRRHRAFWGKIHRMIVICILSAVTIHGLIINPERTQSIGMMWKLNHRVTEGNLDIVTDHGTAGSIQAMIQELKQALPNPSGTLLCLPFNPIWNFAAGRRNPTPYEWLLPGEYPDEASRREVLRCFLTCLPDVIVLNNCRLDGIAGRSFAENYPEMYFTIRMLYLPLVIIDDQTLFSRIRPAQTELVMDLEPESLFVNVAGVVEQMTKTCSKLQYRGIRLYNASSVALQIDWNPERVFRCIVIGMDPKKSSQVDLDVKAFSKSQVCVLEKRYIYSLTSEDPVMEILMSSEPGFGNTTMIEITNGADSVCLIEPGLLPWPKPGS